MQELTAWEILECKSWKMARLHLPKSEHGMTSSCSPKNKRVLDFPSDTGGERKDFTLATDSMKRARCVPFSRARQSGTKTAAKRERQARSSMAWSPLSRALQQYWPLLWKKNNSGETGRVPPSKVPKEKGIPFPPVALFGFAIKLVRMFLEKRISHT